MSDWKELLQRREAQLEQFRNQQRQTNPNYYLLLSVAVGQHCMVSREGDRSGGHDKAFVQFAELYGAAKYGLFLGCQL